jgi:LAO/AO transport system kinase
MSLIEDGSQRAETCLRGLRTVAGVSYVLGITGWPGVGKSTLINQIARCLLSENRDVGIIAIDPTSPFSGGSLLGDRERMKEIDGNERLFIRSAATRGHTGGIAHATKGFIAVMKAMGKEIIILETVGVGQNQVSVIQVADTIVLAVIPGMGDYLQSLKAGVLEIGDIFVVNKSDREGASQTVNDLKALISLNCCENQWKPPIVKAIGTTGQGVEELMNAIHRHRQYLAENNLMLAKRESEIKSEILEIIKSRILSYITKETLLDGRLDEYVREICDGSIDAYGAADEILQHSGIIK